MHLIGNFNAKKSQTVCITLRKFFDNFKALLARNASTGRTSGSTVLSVRKPRIDGKYEDDVEPDFLGPLERSVHHINARLIWCVLRFKDIPRYRQAQRIKASRRNPRKIFGVNERGAMSTHKLCVFIFSKFGRQRHLINRGSSCKRLRSYPRFQRQPTR